MNKRKSALNLKLDIDASPTPKRNSAASRLAVPVEKSPLDQGLSPIKSPNSIPYSQEPVEILEGVYLGNEKNANDLECLRKLNITHILNVAAECRNLYLTSPTLAAVESAPSSPMYNLMNLAGGRRASNDAVASPKTPIGRRPSDLQHQKSLSPLKSGLVAKVIEQLTLQENHNLQQVHLKWQHNQEDIQSDFPEAFRFIEQAIKDGHSVLIHCKQGLSRSAAMAIAYVMHKKDLKFQQAYDLVKSKSPSISPNLNLIYQLHDFKSSSK